MRYSFLLVAIWVLSLAVIAAISERIPSNPGKELDELEVERLEMISPLTGPDAPTNTEARWNIAGTDNGFTFEYDGEIMVVFGDTWGREGIEADDWRSNTLGIIEPDPDHGYTLVDAITDGNGEAKELLHSKKEPGEQYTVMPNGGIAIGNRIYLHYMDIRDWRAYESGYKKPEVNGASFAYSDDGGQSWTEVEPLIWQGDSAFTQSTMVPHGDFVYLFGTPAGRFGAVSLLRVHRDELINPDEYEYWTGEEWSPNASEATEVVPPTAGEISVRWSSHHEAWFMMYRNEERRAIVLRTAPELTGPWDEERVVTTSQEYPRSYAPVLLPIEGPEVHFLMSVFIPDYQVYVMRMSLSS